MQKITAVAALVLGAGYLILARAIPDRVFFDPVGPRIFPTLVAIGIIACGVSLLWPVMMRATAGTTLVREGTEATQPRESEASRLASVLILASVILVYALLVEPVGYIITTTALLLLISSYFNRGRHLQNVAVSVLMTLAIYFGFTEFLRIGLPRGLLAPLL